jgi:hypothetical protein
VSAVEERGKRLAAAAMEQEDGSKNRYRLDLVNGREGE